MHVIAVAHFVLLLDVTGVRIVDGVIEIVFGRCLLFVMMMHFVVHWSGVLMINGRGMMVFMVNWCRLMVDDLGRRSYMMYRSVLCAMMSAMQVVQILCTDDGAQGEQGNELQFAKIPLTYIFVCFIFAKNTVIRI